MSKVPPIPKRKPIKKVVTIPLHNIADINDLISDLREARKLAKRTGGLYSAWRENDMGDRVVFEISFPYGLCIGK